MYYLFLYYLFILVLFILVFIGFFVVYGLEMRSWLDKIYKGVNSKEWIVRILGFQSFLKLIICDEQLSDIN